MDEIKWTWLSNFFGYGWGPSSLIEVIWTSAAAVGFLTTIWLGQNAITDLRALKLVDNYVSYGPRHIIARQNIRNMFFRLFLFAVFFAIGMVAMQTYPAHPERPPTLYSMVLGLGLVVAEFGMMIDTLFDHHDRIELINVMRNRTILPDPYTGEGAPGDFRPQGLGEGNDNSQFQN